MKYWKANWYQSFWVKETIITILALIFSIVCIIALFYLLVWIVSK
jgi:hypothetical protein